jgi:5-methylcytosine-specific restriction endonuclease McrA
MRPSQECRLCKEGVGHTNAQHSAELTKVWKSGNRSRLREYAKEYYAQNDQQIRAKAYEWRRKNVLLYSFYRKAFVANHRFPGHITAQELLAILDKQGTKCYWCGKDNLVGHDLTLEHLKPFNSPENLVFACRSCNSSNIPRRGGKKLTDEERNAKFLEDKRQYHKIHKERQREAHKVWMQKNKVKRRAYMKEYMRRRRGAKK